MNKNRSIPIKPGLSRFFSWWQAELFRPVGIAPLVTLRIVFGSLTLFSTARFMYLGWVEEHFIKPVFHFKYFGFHWVEALSPVGMYAVHYLMLLASVLIVVGWWYRWATVAFFLLFTYCELIELAYYLNHYYFLSIVSLLMVFVPADRAFSLRVRFSPKDELRYVPWWTVGIFKLQLSIVYVYAGLAKINHAWLFEAMPLKIWLPSKSHLPIIGEMFTWKTTPYLYSWAGMLYDSTIPFFLAWKRTRWLAYAAVVVFHAMTGLLFQIGVFPVIMIFMGLIFFSESFHEKLLSYFFNLLPLSPFQGKTIADKKLADTDHVSFPPQFSMRNSQCVILLFFAFQLLFPWRYLLYDGNLFWNEEGYRFSWRVMLVEKAATTFFKVTDPASGKTIIVNNADYLNTYQEKQMSFQPDMIVQFAHFLESEYQKKGFPDVEVRAEAWVTMNGKPSQLLIDPSVDLTQVEDGWGQKTWVLPFGLLSEPQKGVNQ